MKTLVKKDIGLMKINNIMLIIAGFIFGFLGLQTNRMILSKIMYLWAGMIIVYIPLNSLTIEDEKTKDNILKSLPIDREDIVIARYITMLIYIISVFGIISISSYIFFYSENVISLGMPIPLRSLLFNITIVVIAMSIILPFQYFNRGMSKILNMMLYIIFIIGPMIMGKNKENLSDIGLFKYIINIESKVSLSAITILGIIMYRISLEISKKIYKSVDK